MDSTNTTHARSIAAFAALLLAAEVACAQAIELRFILEEGTSCSAVVPPEVGCAEFTLEHVELPPVEFAVEQRSFLSLGGEDVESAFVAEHDGLYDPEVHFYSLHVTLRERRARELARLQEKFPGARAAVILAGRAVGLMAPDSNWARSIPAGWYASLSETGEVVARLGAEATLIPYDAKSAARQRELAIESMLEEYVRDADGRQRLARENPRLDSLVEKNPRLWKRLEDALRWHRETGGRIGGDAPEPEPGALDRDPGTTSGDVLEN